MNIMLNTGYCFGIAIFYTKINTVISSNYFLKTKVNNTTCLINVYANDYEQRHKLL